MKQFDNDTDHSFRELLSRHEFSPDQGRWGALEALLEQQQAKRKRGFGKRQALLLSGIALALVLTVGGKLMIDNAKHQAQVRDYTQTAAIRTTKLTATPPNSNKNKPSASVVTPINSLPHYLAVARLRSMVYGPKISPAPQLQLAPVADYSAQAQRQWAFQRQLQHKLGLNAFAARIPSSNSNGNFANPSAAVIETANDINNPDPLSNDANGLATAPEGKSNLQLLQSSLESRPLNSITPSATTDPGDSTTQYVIPPASSSPIRFAIRLGGSFRHDARAEALNPWGASPLVGVLLKRRIGKGFSLSSGLDYRFLPSSGLVSNHTLYDVYLPIDSLMPTPDTLSVAESVDYKRLHLLEIPLIVSYQISRRFNAHLGVRGGYVFGYEGNIQQRGVDNNNDIPFAVVSLGGDDSKLGKRINRFDFGMLAGLEYRFDTHWSLAATYSLGMNDLSKDDNFRGDSFLRSSDVSLALQYTF